MLSRKQIARMYGIHHQTVSEYMEKAGIIKQSDQGKGNRTLITPEQFEKFRKHFGDPIDKKKLKDF